MGKSDPIFFGWPQQSKKVIKYLSSPVVNQIRDIYELDPIKLHERVTESDKIE